jgi:nitrogen fixation NifU-like protein
MSDLNELYQEVILDHNRRPRNFGALPTATPRQRPQLSGDKLTLRDQQESVASAMFEGSQCISKASASLMTDAIKGHTIAEAETLFDAFHLMVTTPISDPVDESKIGKLAVFAGVREFPARVKCASLAWHTMKAALTGEPLVKTE